MLVYNFDRTPEQLHKVLEKIRRQIYAPVADLDVTAYCTPEPVPYAARQSGTEKQLRPGESWGKLFDCAWFHFRGQVPARAKGRKIVLQIDLSGEACVVDKKGQPWQILTTASTVYDARPGSGGKTVLPFLETARGGERVDLWADAGNNDLFGTYQNNGALQQACIAAMRDDIEQLFYDFEVLLDVFGCLESDTARAQRILHALHRAALCLSNFEEEEVQLARACLAPELAKRNGDASLHVSAIGHAHIDLAWLWPIRETIRKGARTFANVLRMMEKYPDYVFGASQPQLYQWMQEAHPALYRQIKAQVERGRWEPLGAVWVESDTNITGGEALVRQFLYGKRFFREQFNAGIDNLFLPDTFGYSAALPQIMQKAGVRYFITTKMSWDAFNRYPHDTFWWQGIDGSRVLVHMPPEGTYNSSAAPRAVRKAEKAYRDKDVSENCLLVFGIGDGGGGPGVAHLERLQREKDLAGMAPVTQEPVAKFLQRLESNSGEYKTWTGELYLGFHQGTYTTQGRNKRCNRKMELALREAEFLSALNLMLAGHPYPQAELEKIWQEVLLYQFHDILPGSSIGRVYAESLQRYAALQERIEKIISGQAAKLAETVDTANGTRPVVVLNTLPWSRAVWLQITGTWQRVDVPACGCTAVEAGVPPPVDFPVQADETRLENDLLRVRFDAGGNISSMTDLEHDREIIETGKVANSLILYHDDGDAWDFSFDYRHRRAGSFKLMSASAFTDGPRAVLRQQRRYGDSMLEQEIVLTAGSRRLAFHTTCDWQERKKMLRAQFPLALHATESTSDIQFGHVTRPAHRNTSWELAKFEICAHKWIDLSQPDYGVALLKDCKYGHQVLGNLLDINLLRSPTYPDPQADKGRHEFSYALYPHAGDQLAGGVIRAGYEFNIPLRQVPVSPRTGQVPALHAFLHCDAPNIVVEALKKAEDDGGLILRLYEAHGSSTKTVLHLGLPVRAAFATNLLEEKAETLAVRENSVLLRFDPFEIKTIRLEGQPGSRAGVQEASA